MLDLYNSYKIFQINQIYEYELGKFMYKIVHNYFPSFISCCYSHINERHNYSTRIVTNNNLNTTSSKKTLIRRSIPHRVSGVTRGTQFPGRRVTMGAPNHCGGRRKVPTMSQVLSSIQYICLWKTSVSNMGAPNLLLAPGAI